MLSLTSMILGRPNRVMALASVGKTGVDEWTAVTLGYPGARVASLFCSVLVRTRRDAVVVESARASSSSQTGRLSGQSDRPRGPIPTVTLIRGHSLRSPGLVSGECW